MDPKNNCVSVMLDEREEVPVTVAGCLVSGMVGGLC